MIRAPITSVLIIIENAPASARADDDLARAVDEMLTTGLRELPVTDAQDHLIGCIDDQAVTRAYARKVST